MNNSEKVLEILERTNNGNALAPKHLNLAQCVINKKANEHGLRVFEELYNQVKEGAYDKTGVYLYDVEHITKDHQGYIYYKGQHIDHFSHDDSDREKRATHKASKICRLLEEKGHPINSITYCWKIEEYLTPEEIAACRNTGSEMAQ